MTHPKRKAATPLPGGNQTKKGHQTQKEHIPALTYDESVEQTNSGKKMIDDNKKEKGFYNFKGKIVPPDSLEEIHDIKEADIPNLALNQAIQQQSRMTLQGTYRWKAFLLPPRPNSTSIVKTSYSYFGLDLVDEDNERTHWTHKASVWENIFATVLEMAKTKNVAPISPKFDGVLSCPVRATPNGESVIKTFHTSRQKTIQHWIMLVPMPTNSEYSKFVPQFLKIFQDLYKMQYIKSAYKSGVSAIIPHAGVQNAVSEDGTYWKVLHNATENEIIFEPFHCLLEFLCNYTIKEIVSIMFGVEKNPKTWTNTVKAYAFGNNWTTMIDAC